MSRRNRFRQGGRAIFFGVALVCMVAIGFLAVEIVRELRLLNSANSDNVQWTLSQAEVEFLEMRHALDTARRQSEPDLDRLIEEFDIFYSRISTLDSGALYESLRDISEFAEPMQRIRQTLDDLVPLIDGPRADLAAGLPRIESALAESRADLRDLATSGLYHFARQSDSQRISVAVTLSRLGLLTAVLVMVLVFLLRHAQNASRQTERRGHELAAAYTRLNTILDTSLDAVLVADLRGDIQQFNPAAERIFKYDAQQVIGRNIGGLIVPDHLRDAHEAGMARMRAGGERRVIGRGRVRLDAMRSTGEVFPAELALETAHTGSEEIIIGFLRDISHRVTSENELVEARDKALAGEKAKADFLAMMTHEIRTPLNGVLGNLSLLEETTLTPVQSRYVHNMAVSGKLLMSHVDAVLDIARFESGATGLRAEVVDPGRLVQDILDSQTSAAEANGNRLHWAWTGPVADWIRVDASRLQQVLVNLVGNAIKFTRNGDVQVELEQGEPVDPTGGEPGFWLDIRIIDTGVGIAEADLDRVFEDFQTSGCTQDQGLPGTGLGLGIARRFVQAMGGEIGAESTPGEGSVFWLRLPVRAAQPPRSKGRVGTGASPAGPRSILLVEDNEINLQLARDMLHLMGHGVSVARNGQEGVAAAEVHRFDLILMDIRMPVMDGLAATRAIREGQGPNRDAPIVALSANVLPQAKDRFIAGGMSDFLGKPLMKEELSQVIARFCSDAAREEVPPPALTLDDPLVALKARYLEETHALFDWLSTKPEAWTEIADRAHRIAGSAAAFGHPDLRMALLSVETAAEAEDAQALALAVDEARQAWEAAPAPCVA
ncbi:ATP-binding protein [Mameliella alba]|uniref:ATP-binding protein n=1 Tax=Mameliella alba TaxID=561184 RepID=UPI001FD7FA45|nr:ATP-binding protein [Mameliella alba]